MAECTICNDSGYILKIFDGREYAIKCECAKKDINFSRAKKANIPLRFLGAGLEHYYPVQGNISQKKIIKIASKFVNDYPAVGGKGLLFQGSVGVGKTRILCSIASELIEKKQVDLYYIDWTELVKEMRSGEDNTDRDFMAINQLLQKLVSVELLILDELGASSVSKYVYDNIDHEVKYIYNTLDDADNSVHGL